MTDSANECRCLNCDRSDADVPLLALRLAGNSLWICPQCLPILIHHPERLQDKLGGAANSASAALDGGAD